MSDGSRIPEADRPPASVRPDRRARRRQETIEEIIDIAEEVMADEGVNGLTLAEIRQRLGDPPSRINPLVIAALVSVLTACQERCIAFCYYKYYAIHKYDYVWYKEWPSE